MKTTLPALALSLALEFLLSGCSTNRISMSENEYYETWRMLSQTTDPTKALVLNNAIIEYRLAMVKQGNWIQWSTVLTGTAITNDIDRADWYATVERELPKQRDGMNLASMQCVWVADVCEQTNSVTLMVWDLEKNIPYWKDIAKQFQKELNRQQSR